MICVAYRESPKITKAQNTKADSFYIIETCQTGRGTAASPLAYFFFVGQIQSPRGQLKWHPASRQSMPIVPVSSREILFRSLVEGTVDRAVKEVRDQIIEFCRIGRAVKVGGIGTFTPSIDLDGYFSIAFRADPAMNFGLNIPSIFSGTILNREYIGKSSDELVNMWNEEHIDDIITIVD